MTSPKKRSWWANMIGLDDSSSSRDAQERTDNEKRERGHDNLGRTSKDSENTDSDHSCGGGDGSYDDD